MTTIFYKIVPYKNLISWSIKHNNLRIQLETLMSTHRSNENFNIGYFITENLQQNKKHPLISKLIILIENRNKIIGVARSELNNDNVNYISAVHISSTHRGKKLCSQMLQKLIDSYNNEELPIKFSLSVEINNIVALKCYQSIGFVIVNKETIDQSMVVFNMEFTKL